MTEYDIKRFALILAIQAEIEGMKAANYQRYVLGESMEYTQDHFQGAASDLRDLAYKHDHEL